jgi:hypothetical protein
MAGSCRADAMHRTGAHNASQKLFATCRAAQTQKRG